MARILIAGTGALACLFAARLAGAGTEVAMLGSWPEGLAAIHQNGVCLSEIDGSCKYYPARVMSTNEFAGRYEQVFVLVKSWQTEKVAQQLCELLSEGGVALTLQNGLGNDEVLKRALQPERVALGVTTLGAKMLGPGHVQFTGNGKIFLGAHPRLAAIVEMLGKAGFDAELVADPVALLWGKLVINAAINPLSALLRVSNGELLARPEVRKLLAEAAREAATVAACRGVTLPYADPVAMVEEVARGTASNSSSMLQDVLRGANTEVDAINGAIVAEGEHLGVPTPVNRILWQLVSSLNLH